MFRCLNRSGWDDWRHVSEAGFLRQAIADRKVVRTWESAPPAGRSVDTQWAGWLEHERIPFISYPYEWSFGMLQQAALLQLDLMQSALAEECILKDASPFNVQFRGVEPVFIDTASFEPHDGGPWAGYRQFCQCYLYPLMLQGWRGVDFQPLLRGRMAGISPEDCWRLLGARGLLHRGVLSHVYLHSKLSSGVRESSRNIPASLKESGFQKSLVEANVAKLRRLVTRLRWRPQPSRWSNYDRESEPVRQDGAAKEEFVRAVVNARSWGQVWDFGCNLGRYSRIAADRAKQVLAFDNDHVTIERLYQDLRAEGRTNVLPLVFNLADPSPGLGWRGTERSDLTRRGRPDLTICLALIHHLVLRENLLLSDVVDWLADLGGTLIIEFVDKADPQARSLLSNRVDQYDDYSPAALQDALSRRYQIRESRPLPSGTRTLFLATPLAE
ncbi:MAG: class I SAM-dependent methyltransferase [Planctomycetaceae bacterium]